jgi:hypothetical protein
LRLAAAAAIVCTTAWAPKRVSQQETIMANTATTPGAPQAKNQREQLRQSERAATEQEPANFRDVANESKVVEVPPVGKDAKPIRGLDPKH